MVPDVIVAITAPSNAKESFVPPAKSVIALFASACALSLVAKDKTASLVVTASVPLLVTAMALSEAATVEILAPIPIVAAADANALVPDLGVITSIALAFLALLLPRARSVTADEALTANAVLFAVTSAMLALVFGSVLFYVAALPYILFLDETVCPPIHGPGTLVTVTVLTLFPSEIPNPIRPPSLGEKQVKCIRSEELSSIETLVAPLLRVAHVAVASAPIQLNRARSLQPVELTRSKATLF